LKVLDEFGLKLDDGLEDELEQLIWRAEEIAGAPFDRLGVVVDAHDRLDAYLGHRLGLARSIGAAGLRVVLDCANGSGGIVGPRILEATGGRGVDIAIEASSAPPALQQAIAATGQEGTIVVVSYYGTRPVTLTLAPEFHFRRHRIMSSQVSSVGSGLQPRWDFVRRMELVLDLIKTFPIKEMVTHHFDLARAPEAYQFVDTRADETLGVVFRYPQ